MGTRSITNVYQMASLGGEIVCSFYRHFDGYPSGHGKDLSEWLKGKNLVNGIGSGFRKDIDFNRSGSMAIYLMSHICNELNTSVEVIPTGSSDYGEEYIYNIYFDKSFKIETVDCLSDKKKLTDASHYDHTEIEGYFSNED